MGQAADDMYDRDMDWQDFGKWCEKHQCWYLGPPIGICPSCEDGALPKEQIIEGNIELPVKYSQLHWTDKRVIREAYIKQQNGNCYHCGRPLSGNPPEDILTTPVTKSLFPDNFFQHPVHLHHSHDTDLTIGAVHCYCNAVLWEHHGE